MASPTPVAATPMAFVQAILGAYTRYGKDPALALQMAQIAPEDVLHPGVRITAWQMERLSETAMRELDDEALGWFSRRLPWGSYGMLARASISAPTLRLALSRWCRHHGLIAPDISLTLEVADDVATIRIAEHPAVRAGWAAGDSAPCPPPALRAPPLPAQNPLPPSLPTLMREFCLVSVLRNIHGLACWLVDSRILLQAAQFPFAAPAHQSAYAILFSGPTTFGADHAAIHFDARYLSLPLRRDEKALQQMLQHALPLTVLQYRRDRLLVQRVRQTLATHTWQTHSAEALATLLHVSPRTLHRQLKEEGATLQGLKDEVRRTRAVELLNRTERPVKQVAEAAGFQNEKSFIRAFKGWTGASPAEFRRQSAVV
ncbi:MAG: AraC family transcriptional regulator [Burkholderiales bacterium]|nr:AraC family transcriptional regulator [Burkholderiales bacterium]